LGNYGRSFRLSSSSDNGLGAPTASAGKAGTKTGEQGFISYYEICNKIKSEGMTVIRDQTAMAPYGYKGDFWVGYDDPKSMRYKVRTLIKGRGLKGAMFWALDLDDFTGNYCGEGRYPLMNSVKDELQIDIPTTLQPETTKPTTTITEQPQTTTTTNTTPATTTITKQPQTTTTTNTTPVTTTITEQPQTTPIVTTTTTTTDQPQTTTKVNSNCHGVSPYENQPGIDKWCIKNCALGNCPSSHCACGNEKPTTTEKPKGCFAINGWYRNSIMDDWCSRNCAAGHCLSFYCSCDPNWKPDKICHGVSQYKHQPGIDKWCTNNCALGNCPSTHCACN